MADQPRSASTSPSLEDAQSQLQILPDGTYTLLDIAQQWPHCLPAALVLIAEAAHPTRFVTFHWPGGAGSIERSSPRDTGTPITATWSDEEITLRIDGNQTVQVTMGKPKRRDKPRR